MPHLVLEQLIARRFDTVLLLYYYLEPILFVFASQVKSSPYFYHELKLELKGVGPLVTRGGLERSYFCVTDHSMAALVWLRAAMLSSVPGVEIHLHTSHSILLLPVLNLKRRIERALQSMNGRGTYIFNSNCVLYKMVTLTLKSFIVMLETFFAGDTKEN